LLNDELSKKINKQDALSEWVKHQKKLDPLIERVKLDKAAGKATHLSVADLRLITMSSYLGIIARGENSIAGLGMANQFEALGNVDSRFLFSLDHRGHKFTSVLDDPGKVYTGSDLNGLHFGMAMSMNGFSLRSTKDMIWAYNTAQAAVNAATFNLWRYRYNSSQAITGQIWVSRGYEIKRALENAHINAAFGK